MNWATGGLVYVIIWWLVLFCVLPLGIRASEESDIGQSAGAPANPRLVWRLGLTTGIAAIVFAVVFALIKSDWISFRQM
jgi:predicted secreted protein